MNAGLLRGLLWFGAGAIFAAAAMFFFLSRGAAVTGENFATIRSYPVRPEIAGELRAALNSALLINGGPASMGNVSLGPNGSLVVQAPVRVE